MVLSGKFMHPKNEQIMRDLASPHFLKIADGIERRESLAGTLVKHPWPRLEKACSPADQADMEANLHPQTEIGRMALFYCVAEKFFPAVQFYYGDVSLHDGWSALREDILQKVNQKALLKPFITALLAFERPQGVLCFRDQQIGVCYLNSTSHGIEAHQPWEALKALTLVAQASQFESPAQKRDLLLQANSICPGLFAVKLALAYTWMELNLKPDAERAFLKITEERPCALAYYFLEEVCQRKTRAEEVYDKGFWPYLKCHLSNL
jgi:hypothetical protein